MVAKTLTPESRRVSSAGRNSSRSVLLGIFVVMLLTPITFEFAGVLLSPLRLLLLALFPPLIFLVVQRQDLRLSGTDLAPGGFGGWVVLTLWLHHGPARLPYAVLTVLEVLVPYLLGRLTIRSPADFQTFLRIVAVAICVLMFSAMAESLWQFRPIAQVAEEIADTYPWKLDQRLGLWRAQTVFPHPILFGLFAAFFFAVYAQLGKLWWWAIAAGAGATFFSLSAGAWLVLMLQVGFLIWDRLWRNWHGRWWALVGALVLAALTLELLSSRSLPQLLADWLSFDNHNAHWRLLTFQFVADDIRGNPVFGIGMADWTRPEWMVRDSVDNFWLFLTLRFGLPGVALVLLAYIGHLCALMRAVRLPDGLGPLRTGSVMSLVTLGVGLLTVHIWGSMFVLFSFFLGATAWLTEETHWKQ